MRKKIFCSIIISFFAICFALFPGAVSAGPDDEVRVALYVNTTTVNILELKLGTDLPVILPIHEALIASDPKTGERTFKNSLSESVKIMKNKKDIQVKIRKGSVFHTGDALTAHDVKFTYDQCMNPDNAMVMASALEEIEEIEVLDDHNLIFHFYEPYAGWKELLWIGICSKNYYEKAGRNKFSSHPVGSGYFRFVERKKAESVTLEAFEDHPLGKVDYKTLKFLTVPDEVTRLAMLETGEVDLITDILPFYVKRLEKNQNIKIKRSSNVPSLFGLSFKPDNYPILKDVNLQRAFTHAINRQELIDRIFLGEGYPMYMYASKSELGYDPNLKYEFNPDKARMLVKKSSYKPDTELILTYTNDVPNAYQVAALIQNYMIRVGVTIKLQQLEQGLHATYSRTKDQRAGHMSLFSWAGGRDPSMRLILSLPSDSVYCAWSTRPNQKALDALVFKQAREADPIKRRALLKKLHKLHHTYPSGPILFGLNQIYATSNRIDYTWAPKESLVFNLNYIKMVK
ncbi:MAG: ABC transporter substrate-binding protein [Deltaproteobacteria bacterium]|nr:ABC transporter substrate-binding protein [Deltaproteobacteria bacterium]